MIPEGSLQDFSLSDLLQIVSLNQNTGTIRFTSEGRDGLVACDKGEVMAAKAGDLTGEEAVYSLFHWESGRFWFEDELTQAREIELPMAELTKEGIRRLDQWRQIKRELPGLSMETRFERTGAPAPEASAAALEVFENLSQSRTFEELMKKCLMGELSLATALAELCRTQTVEMRHTAEEASRLLFRRLAEGLYERFASISGLKMTEGLESLLNNLARESNTELRWRSGKVTDGIPAETPSDELVETYKRFIDAEMEYIQKIYPASFSQRSLAEIAEDITPEMKECWDKLGLPAPIGAHS